MQVNRMPLDGLWRCLCPSVHAVALTHPQYSLSALRKLHVRTRISSKKPSHRSFYNSTRCLENDVQKIIPSPAKDNLKPTKRIIEKLYKYLWDLRFEEGRYEQILKTVDYLVMAMGEKPSLTHYDALIWANADPRRGSVEVVRNLLKEMEDAKIGADSGLYHTVLKVLTIHPDYALRIQILHEMKERWLSLTPDGLHDLIVGLLRDREFEVAKDKLEYMHAQEIRVEPWLYDIFTYQLCEIDELDEALKLLQYRAECGKTVTPYIWYYLFDTFTSSFHYEGTRYIWDMKVKPGHLNPSDGMCTNILNTVARHPGGDAQLATSALRILSNRKTNISTHHYEALISAYLKSSDMKTAFRILNIMERAGHTLSNSNTRPFYLHLSQGNRFCNEAWDVLITLHSEGRSIPTAAVNVVIESTASCGDFDLALDRYKQLHQVCDGGPNTDTFNALFQPLKNLDNKNSKAVAMFLVSEMKALRVKPSSLTYDRLILVCLGEDDYEDAFRYLEEMDVVGKSLTINEEVENQEDGTKTKEQGWWMRPGTAAAFVNKCANAGDLRAWELLKNMEERGMATFKLTEIVKSKIGSKERIGLRPGPKTNLHWG